MVRTFAGEASVYLNDTFVVGPTRHANVFTGEVDGRRLRFGNVYLDLTPSSGACLGRGTDAACSFVVVDLPTALPPLVVALHQR